ncbi:hypothetical protein O181_061663 [Austropuccinia psidii MF-1]|uniref:Uncharacterized protein n=1 Tax=Austropuccinia psidii MF-1 TaxID=1389203 RepID=A0A9Q3HYS4_9BASI|nr:hypothetical protein [Austropuccinia psidii MF-1]
MKNELLTYLSSLEPSMGQECLKEVPNVKEWPHFSGEGKHEHMRFVIAHRWCIKLRQAPAHQSCTFWKTQIINKWFNNVLRLKLGTFFEYANFNTDKYRDLPWFFQQKDILTALYPYMSEFIIHRKILRECRGDLKHDIKSQTIEQSSEEYVIHILHEVTTRTRIGSSRINLITRFNTPWKYSVDPTPKKILIIEKKNLKIQSESSKFTKVPHI